MGINQSTTYHPQIRQLKKLFYDYEMTKSKLIQGLINLVTKLQKLVVFEEALMSRYSKITTDILDIIYINIIDWNNFASLCEKIFVKDGRRMFCSLEPDGKKYCYKMITHNGTQIKINVISSKDVTSLQSDFTESTLYMNVRGIGCLLHMPINYASNRNGNCECKDEIIKNLEHKILTLCQINTKYADTVLFKVNRLIRLNTKIKKGYTIKDRILRYNILPEQILSQMIGQSLTPINYLIPKPIIRIICGYDGCYYSENAKCFWCRRNFINDECFKLFCDCEYTKENQCLIHSFRRQLTVLSDMYIIDNLWYYECYKIFVLESLPTLLSFS